MDRFIQIRQKDIVTKPEEWKSAQPGTFIKLPNRAKNVYCVLSVISFSSAGNAKGEVLRNGYKLGDGWFWVSHSIIQKLTGSSQKIVQRGITDLVKANMIQYNASKAYGDKSYFKLSKVSYNSTGENRDEYVKAADTRQKDKKGGVYFVRELRVSGLSEEDMLLLWKVDHGFHRLLTSKESERAYSIVRKFEDSNRPVPIPKKADLKPEIYSQLQEQLEEVIKNEKADPDEIPF